jgi:GNAT superfamily N-acetyltransferase
MTSEFTIRAATIVDVGLIRAFIAELADYEKLSHQVVVTDDALRAHLFGPRPSAEVLLGFAGEEAAAFALFFQNFSTFLGRPGLYLEDLFVRPDHRRRGFGRAMLVYLAREANRRGCGRFEWTVLDWNEPAIKFYESLGAMVLPDWRVCRVTGEALTHLGRQADSES